MKKTVYRKINKERLNKVKRQLFNNMVPYCRSDNVNHMTNTCLEHISKLSLTELQTQMNESTTMVELHIQMDELLVLNDCINSVKINK